MNTPDTDVRRLVWQLLSGDHPFPSRALDSALADGSFDPRDRGLAKEMLTGVLRHQSTLEAVASAYSNRRIKEEEVRWALCIGLYQLLFLDRVPVHAAIDATLNAVKPELSPKSGFLNAILRGVSRGITKVSKEYAPSRDLLPDPGWRFDRGVFLDPVKDELGHLAEINGYPRFLLKRWVEQVDLEVASKRMTAMNSKAALWLRVNRLRCRAEQVQQVLADVGIETDAPVDEVMLRVRSIETSVPMTTWPGFKDGWWSVQDLTSYRSLAVGKPTAGERILDLCAAPGGKSFAAYELSGGKAKILACDVSESRLAVMNAEAERLGHDLSLRVIDAEGSDLPEGPWDLVLCDVPCSNTGVLHKRPEARGRFRKEELHKIVTMQNLLRKRLILPALDAKTRVLWTTCSLEPEENQEQGARLAKASGRVLSSETVYEPSAEQAGGYAALVCPDSTTPA